MARTTALLVQGILGDNYDAKTSLQQFIDSATVVVTRVVSCAATKGVTVGSDEAELMERWLAAHYYAQMDQLYASKTTDKTSATFQGKTDLSLASTRYGQSAMNLDYSGCLTAISKRQFAGGIWLGKPISSQVDYRDRN